MIKCSFDPTILIASSNKNTNPVSVKIIKVFGLKLVFLQLLLHLNEDFDDDLLIDALRLLNKE